MRGGCGAPKLYSMNLSLKRLKTGSTGPACGGFSTGMFGCAFLPRPPPLVEAYELLSTAGVLEDLGATCATNATPEAG